jgi:hypothetical protein
LGQSRIRPVTLLTEREILSPDLDALLRLYDDIDDVFQPEFGWIIISHGGASVAGLSGQTSLRLPGQCSSIYRLSIRDTTLSKDDLPSGPYFLIGREVHKALRLYPDNLDAFLVGVIPDNIARPKRQAPFDTDYEIARAC